MPKNQELLLLLKSIIKRIAGKNAEEIVDILFEKENVNEFKIAEKLKRNINEVRNILYKLSSFSVISSIRKKDKRKGWYTYFWTLNLQKAFETLLKFKEQELYNLEHILKSRSLKQFYFCESDNIEMSEETALHHEFLCPECNQLLSPVNEEKKLKEISTRVDAARKETQEIKNVLDKIRQEKLEKTISTVKKKKLKKHYIRKKKKLKKKITKKLKKKITKKLKKKIKKSKKRR